MERPFKVLAQMWQRTQWFFKHVINLSIQNLLHSKHLSSRKIRGESKLKIVKQYLLIFAHAHPTTHSLYRRKFYSCWWNIALIGPANCQHWERTSKNIANDQRSNRLVIKLSDYRAAGDTDRCREKAHYSGSNTGNVTQCLHRHCVQVPKENAHEKEGNLQVEN